jgi:hypothetical protein
LPQECDVVVIIVVVVIVVVIIVVVVIVVVIIVVVVMFVCLFELQHFFPVRSSGLRNEIDPCTLITGLPNGRSCSWKDHFQIPNLVRGCLPVGRLTDGIWNWRVC